MWPKNPEIVSTNPPINPGGVGIYIEEGGFFFYFLSFFLAKT